MTAVGESDPNLATKCLDFCQALSSQGVAFNFSLSIGSTFSFSLDTRGKTPLSPGTKKKSSPSTLRRNARRRKEFLEKKQNPAAVIPREEAVGEKAFLCDQCDSNFKSENGLKIHVGKAHKKVNSTPSSPDNLRGPGQMRSALNTSPLSLPNREENCHNCGGAFSPSHQCDGVGTGGDAGALDGKGTCTCDCVVPICCNCQHEPECTCYNENPNSAGCSCEGYEVHH